MPDRLAHLLRRTLQLYSLVLPLFACCTPAALAQADGSSTALEQRVNHLAEQLRCLVCQNQTIADSHAQLALDLKKEARTQLNKAARRRR
jgi:cytochrome c-type biogenesis protein CcmH